MKSTPSQTRAHGAKESGHFQASSWETCDSPEVIPIYGFDRSDRPPQFRLVSSRSPSGHESVFSSPCAIVSAKVIARKRQSAYPMEENADMKTLSIRLKAARKESGLSQQALADRAQCAQSTIASIERGRNANSTVTVRLAEILGVSPLWLSEGKGDMHFGQPKTLQGTPPYLVESEAKGIGISEEDNPSLFSDSPLMVSLHDAPLVSTEDIMKKTPSTPFLWRSADDHVSTGRPIAAPQGHLALIDPTLEPEAGDLVLVKTQTGRIILRRLAFGGQEDYLATDSGALPAIPFSECVFIGLVVTAMPEPAKRRKRRPS
jgi:transcriptional regulator with XRE-family HTH domain